MSRTRTRARNRRARLEQLIDEFDKARANLNVLAAMVRRVAASDDCVWEIAREAATKKPLDEAELAMIAQIVAPNLAWRSNRRHVEYSIAQQRNTSNATN